MSAGWQGRIRSYSMNAMVGDAGIISSGGFNTNNPDYRQFFKMAQIPRPDDIFVFLDEHPDSIDDGYFLNRVSAEYASSHASYSYGAEWTDLPASYHNNATSFSFADGHSTLHRWVRPSTVRPPLPDAAALPIAIPAAPADEQADFNWVTYHMSIEQR